MVKKKRPIKRRAHLSATNLALQVTAAVTLGIVTLSVVGYLVFLVHIMTLKPTASNKPADIAVVLTGGAGRIEAGFDLMLQDKAKVMLITGVHEDVTMGELVNLWDAPRDAKQKIISHCCITLEYAADSTEANAFQTGRWLLLSNIDVIRSATIITSFYHMPRAMLQYKRALPGVELRPLPVVSKGYDFTKLQFWRGSLMEFGKYILTWLSIGTSKTL